MFGVLKKLGNLFTKNKNVVVAAPFVEELKNFSIDDELKINNLISICKLEFFFINDYGKDIFMETANLFSDDIVSIQSNVIDNATQKINEILDMLTKMDDNKFDMMTIKEINLLVHFYRSEVFKYIVTLNERKDKGLEFFKEYDIYVEAGNRYVSSMESTIQENLQDPLEKHLNEEKKKNIERFKDKIYKLRANKVYHSQSLLQISVIHSISEKIFEQMNEIIFIVIPVLKNKSSINMSIDQMKRIKNNLLSIKEDKDKKINVSA